MLEQNFVYILAVASLISFLDPTDALPLQANPTVQHIQDVRKNHNDMQALSSDQNLNLFQRKSALDKAKKKDTGPHVQPEVASKNLQMIAQVVKRDGGDDAPPDDADADGGDAAGDAAAGGDGAAAGDAEAGGAAAGGTSAGGATGNDTAAGAGGVGVGGAAGGGGKPAEITISMPKFEKDHLGNWIYQLWGATYGQVWGDTRFNKGRFTIPRIRVDSNAPNDYYPDGPRSTVCLGSTVYNVPRVVNWLKRNVYAEEHKHRPFWDNLREQIFIQGRSEECHDAVKFEKWKDYQECAMRRNQRLEYMIPKYPLHQIGYKGHNKPTTYNN